MDHKRIIEIANVLYRKDTLTAALEFSVEELNQLVEYTTDVGSEISKLLKEELRSILTKEKPTI